MNKLIFYSFGIAFCLAFQIAPATAQTQISPKYSVDGTVRALANYGDTLIVGGDFNNVGVYTGGGALFTATGDQPNLNFPKILGSVYASTSDGAGGFYIAGIFTKESEPISTGAYARIEHVLTNNTFEPGFSLTVSALFPKNLTALLYHNGLLYIGGSYIDHIAGQAAGDLCAIDVATKLVVNWIPPIVRKYLGGVSTLFINQNTLYFAGGFDSVGSAARKNIAAIQLYTGNVKPWNFGANFTGSPGCNDIVAYQNKVIIGGNFGIDGGGPQGEHGCAIVDTINGLSVQYIFRRSGLFGAGTSTLYFAAAVSCMAISEDTLFTYTLGTFDTRVTAINLADSNRILWARYFNTIANATEMKPINGTLYVAGYSFTDVYNKDSSNSTTAIERKTNNGIAIKINDGNLVNWFPDPTGLIYNDVWAMSNAGSTIFCGGTFSHVNGVKRTGIAMLKTSTQQVLPFNIDLYGESIRAFKISDNTLYAAGSYLYINSVEDRRSVLSFNLTTDSLLPWNPGNLGQAYAIEANNQYVFLGGSLNEPPGGAGRQNLFAIDRQSAALASWAPNPDRRVSALHLSKSGLYTGGDFRAIGGEACNFLSVFDTGTLSITNWRPQPNGEVLAINSIDGTVWIGGNFFAVNSVNCNGFAGISTQSGSISHQPVTNFTYGVNTIAVKGCYVFLGGSFNIASNCGRLAAYNMYTKTLVPAGSFCPAIEDGVVNALAFTGNDLHFGGSFLKVNGKANAPNLEKIQFPPGYFAGCGEYITVQNGNWNDPATWLGNTVPTASARAIVRHHVTITASTNCFSIKVEPGGFVNVTSGAAFKVVN